MIDKIRNAVTPMFEDTHTEKIISIKVLPIVLWAVTCGAIGGVMPFLIPTCHSLIVSLVVCLAVMAITFYYINVSSI